VRSDESGGAHWSDLVNGLLDARTDPATARFDAELASAVAAGRLSRRTAQRLRFWQRAAVNAAHEHARTVVPAVLGVLEAARSEAQAYVEQGSAMLDSAGDGDGAAGTDALPRHATHDTTSPATTTAPAPGNGVVPPQRPWPVPVPPPTAAQQAEATGTGTTGSDPVRRASSAGAGGTSTLEEPTPRLFVADLRDVSDAARPA
jgi:hypothetical protein